MRIITIFGATAVAACLAYAVGRAADQAAAGGEGTTTRPAAAAISVRGRVSVGGGIGLHKADLSRAVVYVAAHPELDRVAPSTQPATISQRNKQFVPSFLVVARNTVVEFPNWDRFDHNVFSRSKAAPAFDLDRYPYGTSKARQFEKEGVVQVFCNVHPDMRAIIVVTPNVYFARADAEGRFEIRGLPPGKYELVAWQERCEEQRKAIVIGTDGTAVEMDFAMEESRQKVMTNSPPQRGDYGGVERGLGVKRERLDLPVVRDAHPAPGTGSTRAPTDR